MFRRFLLAFAVVALSGLMGACNNEPDVDYVAMDRTWDSADTEYMTSYDSARAENERLQNEMQALSASGDTAAAATRAEAITRLEAHNKTLQDLEAKRAAARASRDSARTAANKAAYDAARAQADYAAWRMELERIRKEQGELEGTIKIGSKTIGAIDANVKDTSKPLIRVEPGKNDDKPLIEKNKNP